MTRFMKPHIYEKRQQGAVGETLEQLDIGDAEGRRIFIIALGYELADYEEQPQADAPPQGSTEQGSELIALAAAASAFAEQLQQLKDPQIRALCDRIASSDPFQRGHDGRYLDALGAELRRLIGACSETPAQDKASTPSLTPAQARLIGNIAEAYRECFELDPADNGCQPFAPLLQSIIEISGMPFRIDASSLQPLL